MTSNLNRRSSALFRNPHLLFLTIAMLVVAGLSALNSLPRLEDPRITTRNALVLTPFPGASAERVEILVTEIIEQALQEMHEIKIIRSTSRAGMSVISIELQAWVDATNNETIFSKVRAKIDDVKNQLPTGALPPQFDSERGATAFTLIAALSPKLLDDSKESEFHPALVTRLSESLADRLRGIHGTELVRTYGAHEEEVLVAIKPNQLISTGMDIAQLARAVANSDSKQSAGRLQDSGSSLQMQLRGEFKNLDDIAQISVATNAQDNALRLADIATIEKSIKTPVSDIALINGQKAVFVAARMDVNQRIDTWSAAAKQALAEFKTEHQGSLSIDILFDQSTYTDNRLSELSTNLLLGSVLVVLVVLVFMGWKAALIVGAALPLSSAATLFGLTLFGEKMHQMSIFGLIIAIGLLIDNAIVITDEIRKQLAETQHRLSALNNAIRQLMIPLSASTLTTILGFMPIFLLPGNIGDFVGPIAISVVLALASSLVLSLTVIATLTALFLPKSSSQSTDKSFYQSGVNAPGLSLVYRYYLGKALERPFLSLGLVLLFPLSGVLLAQNLGNVFFPSADRDQFEIHLWLPEQAHIDKTRATALKVDQTLAQHPSVKSRSWVIGGANPSVYYNQIMKRDNLSSYAHGIIQIDDPKKVAKVVNTLQQHLDETLLDAKVVIKLFGQGPPITAPISFELLGENLNELAAAGRTLQGALEAHPGIVHAFSSLSVGEPKIEFRLNNEASQLAGLSRNAINAQLQAHTDGVLAGSLIEGNKALPVRIKTDAEFQTLQGLQTLPITSSKLAQNGLWTTPQALGSLELVPQVRGITHYQGERVNIIEAYLRPGEKAIDVSKAVLNAWQENHALPPGIKLRVAGESDKQGEAVSQLGAYLPVLIVLMAATLILSFRSVTLSLVIASVAVLSIGLGLLALSLSGLPIGFNPLLGLAGLVGVAINGSIVVIAAMMTNPHALEGQTQAIVKATHDCTRHIISTTITTVGGFIPILLWSEGTFWPPLAVVIAGGVGFSIMLSLLYTPIMMKLVLSRRAQLRRMDRLAYKNNFSSRQANEEEQENERQAIVT